MLRVESGGIDNATNDNDEAAELPRPRTQMRGLRLFPSKSVPQPGVQPALAAEARAIRSAESEAHGPHSSGESGEGLDGHAAASACLDGEAALGGV